MAQRKKRDTKREEKIKKSWLDEVQLWKQYLIAFIVITIPLLYFLAPYALKGQLPSGTDVVGSRGNVNLILNYENESGETALWNPALFGGMPIYSRINIHTIHVDTLLSFLGKIFYNFYWYLLIGGMGLFLFLKQKKIPWYAALIPAVAFAILPDWQAMIGNGHFSKIRAIMILPWLLASFDFFIERKSWLSAGLFALVFSWLVRTQHFQILFYGLLMLLFLYIVPLVKLILNKKYKEFAGFALKFFIAVILTVLTAAQPLLTTQEYAQYSTRGGNPVAIGEKAKSANESGGVSFDYATQWSLAPREIIDFFIPRFTGGTSAENYDGDEYPNVKGQQVPGYWGEMPFTDNYDAMGMLLFLFALFGLVYYRKNNFVIALGVFIVFAILLALGRHFPALYSLFYEVVPYFSKFRVPVMMAHIVFLATFILGGFGLSAVFNEVRENNYKKLFGVFGTGIIALILVLLIKDSFAYVGANEAGRYDANTLQIIKGIRKEFLTADTFRVLIFVAGASLVLAGFLFGKIKKEFAVILVFLFVTTEIFSITNRQVSKIDTVKEENLESRFFQPNPITEFLSSKEKNMRVLAISNAFQSNYYPYYYPAINGYSAIKLQLIQDVIDHNLFNAPTGDRLNWPVINMLNGKYIISQQQLSYGFLSPVATAPARQEILYRNENVLPKAWFVKEVKRFDSDKEVVLAMNDSGFNPDSVAYVIVQNPAGNYSGEGEIELMEYSPNKISFNLNTERDQFLVLSEVYYPAGWNATFNGEELKIYQTNYILRGVKIPGGEGELVFKFEPQLYYTSLTLTWVGNILILLLIAGGYYLRKRREKI